MGNFIPSPRNNINIDLNEDVLLSEILPKLPVKSLMRFKCVSKKWLHRISNDPSFAEAQFRHYQRSSAAKTSSSIIMAKHLRNGKKPKMLLLYGDNLNPKVKHVELSYLFDKEALGWSEMDIIGSSRGLVLVTNKLHLPEKELVLWNPETREFRVLPQPIKLIEGIDFDQLYLYPILDLGFDEKSKDHKVVRVVETTLSAKEGGRVETRWLNLQLFSKNSDSWKKLKPLKGYKLLSLVFGVSWRGVLYLLSFRESENDERVIILSFDFSSEEAREFAPLPGCYPTGQGHFDHAFSLTKWKENSLGLVARCPRDHKLFDFWAMDVKDGKDNNKAFSWSWLFTFDFYSDMCGIWGDRFPIVQKTHWYGVELRWWDPDDVGTKGSPKITKLGRSWSFSDAHNYIPSMFSVYPRHLKAKEME